MSSTNDFVLTSDYGAIGNDGNADTTVTVPSGFVLPAGGGPFGTPSYSNFDTIISVGEDDDSVLYRIQWSTEPGKWYTRDFVKTIASDASGSIHMRMSVQKLAGSLVRCRVTVDNYYAGTVATASTWTVNFHVLTFKRV